MLERERRMVFRSTLREWMPKFIQEKQALGHNYETEYNVLCRLDRRLCEWELADESLPRAMVARFTAASLHETPGSQGVRVRLARQFAKFLRRNGIDAYVLPERLGPVRTSNQVPYVFSHEQISAMLAAVDRIEPEGHCPLRHLIMPEVFRLLYGSGMRVNEVLRLRVADVDLGQGVLTVREAKFRRDRLVPVGAAMAERLRAYASRLGKRLPMSPFFPAPDGGPYNKSSAYYVFRYLLRRCGIPHGGRGRGPRLHDLRHTFAVHRLASWYRQGADLVHRLPYLCAYMAHRNLAGTQRYLRLTPEIFPDIVKSVETFAGRAIPQGPPR
jgi:integrase/recombinase XerD